MRPRKSVTAASPMRKFGQTILGYIDLFVRTICIILGLVVSGWVKFIDETPPAAASKHGIAAPQGSTAYSLSPLPITAAQPIYTGQPPLFR